MTCLPQRHRVAVDHPEVSNSLTLGRTPCLSSTTLRSSIWIRTSLSLRICGPRACRASGITPCPRSASTRESASTTGLLATFAFRVLAGFAMAGFDGYLPDMPARMSDIDPSAYDPRRRLSWMDQFDIEAQVLYPNVVAFFGWAFIEMQDQPIAVACVSAYNDFLAEFASANPNRLIPVCALPFWNIEASVRELERAHGLGHRGVVFGWQFENIGLPRLVEPHWDPILSKAQELGMSINLHVAASTRSKQDVNSMLKDRSEFSRPEYAKQTALMMASNLAAIAELTTSDLLLRYPRLKWVSVESGFGYIPFLLETLDWQWHNSGAASEQPGAPLPSERFREHMFGSFWFEKNSMSLLPEYADNIMFETDYPHPTCLCPGPASIADPARVMVKNSLSGTPDDVIRKVLWSNAATLYGVPDPVR